MPTSPFSSSARTLRAGFLVAALIVLLPLGACGGSGSDDASPPVSGGNPGTAAPPTVDTQPAAQSVTAPSVATFTVAAGGSAPLAYQWRTSPNGSDWADISGANSASFTTGATDAAMNGRYYAVVISNSAGSVTSNSARLTVQTAGSGSGPSGVFPHAANPLAMSVTLSDAALTAFGITSVVGASEQAPAEATGIALASGVTLSIGVPGNAFLEDQTLAVTPVTLAALDATHPLPFQSVIGAFNLASADGAAPELATNNLVRISFTLSQAALDALGGRAVIFSARSDGTQVRLLPVFANADGTWSALAFTARVGHLGVFGIASVSDTQASSLAAGWPTYSDFQLEAALAPPSYELRNAVLAAQPGVNSVRARSLGQARAAGAASGESEWFAQMQAQLDAYYNDQVVPAINAANTANADIAQFQDASQKILSWERMRQLLGLQDERDAGLSDQLISLTRRGLDKAKDDCTTNRNAAAAVQLLGTLRQLALMGIETDTSLEWVQETCGRSTYDVSMNWSQAHSYDVATMFDGDPANANTGRMQLSSTLTGKLHGTGIGAELTQVGLDYNYAEETACAVGAYRCSNTKSTTVAHDTAAQTAQCGANGFSLSYRVERWNLDARGHYATPTLYLWFQNAFGCAGGSFSGSTNQATYTLYDASGNPSTRTVTASETVDTAPWSGTVNLGTSSRIVRSSAPVTGQFVVAGATQRWSTSLTFNIVEVKPTN